MEKRVPAIYTRKSKITGKGESIENQAELCRAYLRLHFGEEAAKEAKIYEDEGFSGGTLKRPRFQKLMEDAKNGLLSSVVVYRLDRISRNIGDFAGLIEELDREKVAFLSIREQFDTDSPMGRAMMYIASVFSQLERETIAERIRDNMQELSKTGRWLGGTTPLGFSSESVSGKKADGKSKKICRLKAVPEELMIVKKIFSVFLETGSLTKTEQILLEKGCKTRRGGEFTRFSIRGILANPVYAKGEKAVYEYFQERGSLLGASEGDFDGTKGLMVYNRTDQKKSSRNRDIKEWIVALGEHKGVIPAEKWIEVQMRLEENRSKSYKRPRSHEALLAGFLFCGDCKHPMRPKLSEGEDEEGKRKFRYLCTRKERSGGALCQMKNPEGKLLDQAVYQILGEFPEDRERFYQEIFNGKEAFLEEEREKGGEEERKNKIKKINADIKELKGTLMRAAGTLAETDVLETLSRLHEEKERLEKESQKEAEKACLSSREFQETLEILGSYPALLKKISMEERRFALKTFCRRLEWDGERLYFYFAGEK